MKIRNRVRVALIIGALMASAHGPAIAQGFDSIKGALGGLGSGSASGGAGLQSGSLANAAGVLEYCIKNKYLSGGSASSLKDQLLGKLSGTTGQPAQKDEGYLEGAKGLLQTGSGNTVSLGGDGLKAAATQQACDAIMNQARAFL
ncbi:DUF2501 domain-containing protein [Bordetella flabilis]|uniref:DUF2501 domain-containing protein n=1 Tax=Bordetella flabilis TaxID=463014 RepID=A0A193GB04_9BORD|nr:DUF2501 domain-containing protein [Bordetella flabilis]ANN76646.1 hypothetical protein BAU07_05485 [Bordetella flabilis]